MVGVCGGEDKPGVTATACMTNKGMGRRGSIKNKIPHNQAAINQLGEACPYGPGKGQSCLRKPHCNDPRQHSVNQRATTPTTKVIHNIIMTRPVLLLPVGSFITSMVVVAVGNQVKQPKQITTCI